MIRTYIRVPNSSTTPPPDGPIHLGHILDDLTELRPLNRKSRLEVPLEDLLPPHEQPGFEATRKTLVDGTFGIGAKLLSILGGGIDAKGLHGDYWQETIRAECLRTIAFIPTDEYIQQTLGLASIQSFLESSNYKHALYLVTGLKVAVGASVQTDVGRRRGTGLDLAVSLPGIPVEVGPTFEYVKAKEGSESFQSSTFVLAFQVEKIKVKKQGFSHKLCTKGGLFGMGRGDSGQGVELEFFREQMLADEDIKMIKKDSQGEVFELEEGRDVDGPGATFWVIPQIAPGITQKGS